MDTNKNSYTIIYATVLVVFVAAVLAFVSSSLKDQQQRNIDVEKQLSLLFSVGLAQDVASAPDKNTYVESEYNKYIKAAFIVNYKGETVEGDAFKVDLKEQFDIMKQVAAATDAAKQDELKAKIKLPVFMCVLDNKDVYILSCYGAGLWGPIWGYLAIDSNFDTIYGATFSHKGETPGLGAEIAIPAFSNQFKNKELFTNGTFSPILIVKGGAPAGSTHEVDAISGGTITSKALEGTITSWLEYYLPYMEAEKQKLAAVPADSLTIGADSLTVTTDSLMVKADSTSIK
ncbi:MAG: NADH:ubiquinone reductase (Na(+)-transporting) subunit C [Bacteroidales bacterium]